MDDKLPPGPSSPVMTTLMKMVLAKIVTRTELTLVAADAVRVGRRSITLMPSEGLRVRLDKRARAA